ncbi:MAG: class I SAM-dependent methyltransferase [Caulobacterales bacterium]
MDRQVYDRMRLIEADHWWFRGRRKIIGGLIGELPLPRPARIAEVGSGTGGNLPMLAQFGEVTGMEPDADSRAYAQEKTGRPVKAGFLPADLPFETESLDLAAAFDVIEHVDEDAASVAALAGLLKPGGFLATTVPAHPWMWSRHDEAHHHKRRYRMAQYRALFDQAGLKIVKASYFNCVLFPPIAAVRLAKNLVKSQSADDDAIPPGPVNSLFAAAFASELGWLRHASLPFGVSIILIAQKPERQPEETVQ